MHQCGGHRKKAVSLSSIVVGSQCIISKMQKSQQNSSVNILFRIMKVNNRRDKKGAQNGCLRRPLSFSFKPPWEYISGSWF